MRTCTNCYKSMVEGYLLEEMGFTFCSDFCLDIAYPGSSKEMANMTDEQLEDSTWYWTSWEEDDNEEDDGPGEPGECPRCFEPLEDGGEASRNSICRIDNQTVICNDCGTEQAFKEWDTVPVNKYHYEDYEDGTYFEDGE